MLCKIIINAARRTTYVLIYRLRHDINVRKAKLDSDKSDPRNKRSYSRNLLLWVRRELSCEAQGVSDTNPSVQKKTCFRSKTEPRRINSQLSAIAYCMKRNS